MSDDIIVGDATLPAGADDCGCCGGTGAALPATRHNPPGQPAIAYRAGTHAEFKQAMLALLSSPRFPALGRLATRADDDFAIALIDSWATVCDVLSFYQERLANEAFLPTAGETLSITELARLVGYRRRPGLAASVDLAFTLEPAPGAPEQAVAETAIPAGSKVQSIPGPGERSQSFETVEAITGRVAWNALKARQTVRHRLRSGDRIAFLKGAALSLRAGDVVLLADRHLASAASRTSWELRTIIAVETDAAAERTAVTLDRGLGAWVSALGPDAELSLFVMRQRAALFAYNAPHPSALHPEHLKSNFSHQLATDDWPFAISNATLRLDNAYPGIVPGSWLVLAGPDATALYRVEAAAEGGWTQYLVSGKSTRLRLDTSTGLDDFDAENYRSTAVHAQAEPLALADAPVVEPVWGETVVLDALADGLPAGRRLILRGKRPRVRLNDRLTLADVARPGETFAVAAGETLTVAAPPVALAGGSLRWSLASPGGREGTVDIGAMTRPLAFLPAGKDDPLVAEVVTLDAVEAEDPTHSRLRFGKPLTHAYDRTSLEVLANVARATHGESASDILGAGDAAATFQRFTLRQPPLTHVRTAQGEGRQSTLAVRVNDVLWDEVPYLYGHGPRERVYATRLADDGSTLVEFGDGLAGARLPTGRDNVVASYRKGSGLEGLVRENQLSLLASRPLGVKAVTNPLAAEGAQDPERMDEARSNVPASVLTLGRTVSLRDYEDHARSFAGIAKAQAALLWDGRARRVFLTVAGADGLPVAVEDMLQALRGDGDPFVALDAGGFRPVEVRLSLRVKVDPKRRSEAVLAALAARMRETFGFEARRLGQPLHLSEVFAAAAAVPGVEAVIVDRLYRTRAPDDTPERHARLAAASATRRPDGGVDGAELLMLAAEPFDRLEVLP
ncbi:hypothetical protein [Ancylobacter oerskovii]|uniref:Baseplate assembly protein n=1 Tax=Ancylobacter oerskovii TaxID=459519 RepID=A0ABW4Z1I4_9HYPH|nr:hypothetical protein [Ancylobacter oerskovii]MBS7542775.1 hypothetical protein [Ancylobacter oerskovii]